VLDGSWGRWALEVKTGSVSAGDLKGVAEFTRRFPDYRPLVLCDPGARAAVERSGLGWLDWREFLLDGPPGARARGTPPAAAGVVPGAH